MDAQGLGIQGVGQVSIHVRDVEPAVAFYRDVLGLSHLFTFGTLAFFQCGEVRLFVSVPEQHRQGDALPPSSVVYFRVPDIHAAYARRERQGVGCHAAPHLIHRHPLGREEWMAFFTDPDGNMLALMSQVEGVGRG